MRITEANSKNKILRSITFDFTQLNSSLSNNIQKVLNKTLKRVRRKRQKPCKVCKRMSKIRRKAVSCRWHRPVKQPAKMVRCNHCGNITKKLIYSEQSYKARNVTEQVDSGYWICTACDVPVNKEGNPMLEKRKPEVNE